MKKILLTFSLLAMLITVACDTSKSSVATAVAPQVPQTPEMPKKGEMNASDMQAPMVQPYKKKMLSQKGGLQPMEAVSSPDTIVPKH